MQRYHKPFKFLLSGAAAALTEYITFTVLLFVVPIMIANPLSFLCGLVVSFTLNRNWVFNSKTQLKTKLIKYFLLALFNMILSTVSVYLLTHLLGPFAAKIIVMVCIAAWNYLIFSRLIFKDEER